MGYFNPCRTKENTGAEKFQWGSYIEPLTRSLSRCQLNCFKERHFWRNDDLALGFKRTPPIIRINFIYPVDFQNNILLFTFWEIIGRQFLCPEFCGAMRTP